MVSGKELDYLLIYRKEFLNSRDSRVSETFVSSILALLDLCRKNDYFASNEICYEHLNGLGTGITLAQTWTCLGIGKF